jgi:hypothetical protein
LAVGEWVSSSLLAPYQKRQSFGEGATFLFKNYGRAE